MLDVRPIGIEDYTERCSTPLSALHDKLWVETYVKSHSPGIMIGPLVGQFFKMLAALTARGAFSKSARSLATARLPGPRRCPKTGG